MPNRRLLLVAANPSVSTTLGWPVGFWAAELIHPFDAFAAAGLDVVVASPDGGEIRVDAWSDPSDPSGYAAEDRLSASYLARPDFRARLAATPAIRDVDATDFEAIVIVGGQSPLFTFRGRTDLMALFRAFLDSGRPAAALCHGTCLLLELRADDGTPMIRGRRMTGFTNAEEDDADQAVGRRVMPFRIEDEARSLGARFEQAAPFTPFAVQDGNLITGQQQNSGAAVAGLVLAALGLSNPSTSSTCFPSHAR